MKYIFIIALFIESQAHADFFFIQSDKIYSVQSKYSPEKTSLDKAPSAPQVIAGEGCAENPMSWLKSSKVLGKLKKKDSAMYVQIAPEAISFGKNTVKCLSEIDSQTIHSNFPQAIKT